VPRVATTTLGVLTPVVLALAFDDDGVPGRHDDDTTASRPARDVRAATEIDPRRQSRGTAPAGRREKPHRRPDGHEKTEEDRHRTAAASVDEGSRSVPAVIHRSILPSARAGRVPWHVPARCAGDTRQRPGRTGGDGTASARRGPVVDDLALVDHCVAPLVEPDALGTAQRADAVPVAERAVEDEPDGGTGGTG
jgi:hypothetical protein